MKNCILSGLIFTFIFSSLAFCKEAVIEIENKPLHKISNLIYGNFVEFLGKTDGGLAAIWDYEKDYFREDVIKKLKELNIPILRFPGGCFADVYHWRDGIGKRSERRIIKNKHWGGYEDNKIGTDEFIELCRMIGAEPLICVNFGTGTPKEAAEWVDYCNNKNSYNVKYWEIGNEIYGFWEKGHTNAYNYAKRYLEFAEEMKKADKNIKLLAVGKCLLGQPWNEKVLRIAGDDIDYLTLHLYTLGIMGIPMRGNPEDIYYSVQACSQKYYELPKGTQRLIKRLNKNVKIAVTEWNVNFAGYIDHWEEKLKAAIFVASVLNTFQRLGSILEIANLSDLVNTKWSIGCIRVNEDKIYATPSYYVLKLYSTYAGEFLLPVKLRCKTHDIYGPKDIPYLDVSASVDDKKLYIHIVNRNITKNIATLIKLKGFNLEKGANIFYINGDSIESRNTFENPELVKIKSYKIDNISNSFTYTSPAHSITVMELFLK